VPDLALEVITTHAALDKLEVYRGLGVGEVWLFEAGAFKVLALRGERYERVDGSLVLPEVDLARIAHFAIQEDQHAALRAFRAELRG
jgi:Uma2 family endonuclease